MIKKKKVKKKEKKNNQEIAWLEYWFTPSLSTPTQFSRRLVLAQEAFALVRRLSPPGAGLAHYLRHRLATSLVAPILLYGAYLFTPNAVSFTRLTTFWQKVQRWATNCFLSTPIRIVAIESCLPPIPLLVSLRQRLAARRAVCCRPLSSQQLHYYTPPSTPSPQTGPWTAQEPAPRAFHQYASP